MDYAVIKIKGEQFIVSKGDTILVPYTKEKVKAEVLFFSSKGKVTIGKPVLSDKKVKLSVVSQKEKGKKINGLKYKAKSRYRKRFGFRHTYTKVSVDGFTS